MAIGHGILSAERLPVSPLAQVAAEVRGEV